VTVEEHNFKGVWGKQGQPEKEKKDILEELTKNSDVVENEGVDTKEVKEDSLHSPEPSLDIEPDKPKLSITEKLNAINEKFDEIIKLDKKSGKKKKLFGFSVNTKLKALAKKNDILVILLKINRGIEALICEVKDGYIKVKDNYHKCSTDFVFLWNGKFPCIILPEWDLQPIGTADYYKAAAEGRSSSAAKTIISMIEKKEVLNQKKLSGKLVIGIIIGAVIVFYILFAGG